MAKKSSGPITYALPCFFSVAILVEVWFLYQRWQNTKKVVACPEEHPCRPELAPPAPLISARRQTAPARVVQPSNATKVVQQLPFFDIAILVFATGSEHDVLRMQAAAKTWLNWTNAKAGDLTMNYIIALCENDPNAGPCEDKKCARAQPNVVLLPCDHGYSKVVTKSIEGFRYISSHFSFRYVIKVDVDTVFSMNCAINAILNAEKNKRCKSFGMGGWRRTRDSKVFPSTELSAIRYANDAFKEDTGMDWYPPYMTGWMMIWSGDVARFLGMAGQPKGRMPTWRPTWTIDDAALGTFVIGLDVCRLPLFCRMVTDVDSDTYIWKYEEVALGKKHEVPVDGPVEGFEGPIADDVPNIGDIANTHAETLEDCAKQCRANRKCRSFEHSPTVGRFAPIKNCQLATGTFRAGAKFQDFSLYLKKSTGFLKGASF